MGSNTWPKQFPRKALFQLMVWEVTVHHGEGGRAADYFLVSGLCSLLTSPHNRKPRWGCRHSASLLPFAQSGPSASEIAPPTFGADLAPSVSLSKNTHLTYTPIDILHWYPNPIKLTTEIPHTILWLWWNASFRLEDISVLWPFQSSCRSRFSWIPSLPGSAMGFTLSALKSSGLRARPEWTLLTLLDLWLISDRS